MKIATWNVNSLTVRLPHVLTWIDTEKPDILALQETKLVDEKFPRTEIEAAGYQVVYAGQKTYNGVAILSRAAASQVETVLPGMDDPQCRFLAASYQSLRVIDVYVPNGQAVGSEKYQYKLAWLEKLKSYVRAQLTRYPQLVVLGDFNIAPQDRDVHDPQVWAGQVLCSEAERAALQGLVDLGLHDSFRLFDQEAGLYSWWDYRAAGFRRNHGLRIDHVLVSQALAGQCRECHIDKAPRAWERPSDHAPVWAAFDLA